MELVKELRDPGIIKFCKMSLAFLFCLQLALSPVFGNGDVSSHGAELFYKLAHSMDPSTDKCEKHRYHIMYGRFLVPRAEHHKHIGVPMKFLEIGLGCNMQYGSGASVKLWKTLLGPEAEIWEADYDEECVKAAKSAGKLDGIHVLTGDQGNVTVLNRWVSESTASGKFDAIIDDGGHTRDQIMTSFQVLWPQVKPGGYYFIEDIEHSKTEEVSSSCAAFIIQHWIDQMLKVGRRGRYPSMTMQGPELDQGEMFAQYPLPKNVEMIACQLGACVFIKCHSDGKYCSSEFDPSN